MNRIDGHAADPDSSMMSRAGEPSRVFAAEVGRTFPAAELADADLLIDRGRFDSEGDWAFCRFSNPRVPALRFGYQLGSFAIGSDLGVRDPSLLQLHLEVMTDEGGYLWVPTGRIPGSLMRSSNERKDVLLEVDGRELLRISGWPEMTWHVRSDDDELEAHLDVSVQSVSILPDCLLPHCIFAMWETLARAKGQVRVGSRRHEVDGYVFFDHTRVVHREHRVKSRRMYLYTTLALADGGGIFGYHAVDSGGDLISYYCFGIHVDASGIGTFLGQARTSDIEYDAEGLPRHWRLDWRDRNLRVEAWVDVRPLPLARGWGGPQAPRSRARWSIFPLVLDADVEVARAGRVTRLDGSGLAEYFDTDRWFAGPEPPASQC